ncbi:MAG: glycosyltransferase family 39 protein [Bacteroidia bacterium]|jgi:hypothetical protein|nr:glycosyltransferase family 39 protein [Bacteroidia bacterium]GIV23232.1 MAG: hypothetical protein KatS3mg025_0891 [Bacteroidia bacterium]
MLNSPSKSTNILYLSSWRTLFANNHEVFFIYVAILHIFVRMIILAFFSDPPHGLEDLDIAVHLARGEGFSFGDRGPTTCKGPFYPSFLAFFIWIGFDPLNLWPVALIQHILLAFVPFLMYKLGKYMGYPRVAQWAALFFAIHPSYLYAPKVLENTSLLIFLSVLWGITLYRLRENPNWAWVVFIGLWLGLSWIEKPPVLLPMGLAILLIVPRKYWLPIGLIGFLPVGLWALRGYLVFGYPTWSKTYAGQSSLPIAWTPSHNPSLKYALSVEFECYVDSLLHVAEAVSGPEFERLTQKIIKEKIGPIMLEKSMMNALMYWWIPWRYWGNNSLSFWIARKIPVILINTFFLLGVVLGFRRYKGLILFVLLVSAIFTATYAFYHALYIRYKLDIEWLQLYVCAIGALEIKQRVQRLLSGD